MRNREANLEWLNRRIDHLSAEMSRAVKNYVEAVQSRDKEGIATSACEHAQATGRYTEATLIRSYIATDAVICP